MGTRGSFGFRANQADVLFYNHFDSYPDGLGVDIVAFCKQVQDWDAIRERTMAFVAVIEVGKPTEAQKARARELGTIDLSVSEQSEDDFYCLTRKAQGNIPLMLELGFGAVSNDFVTDSLFCEYAYVVNLDTMELEFYEGFNKDRAAEGRYAARAQPTEGYAGVKLMGTCPLTDIPDDWAARFYPEDPDND